MALNSYLPQWFSDVAAVSSAIGLVVTVFLFLEARKIRKSFLRRARVPQIAKELSAAASAISRALTSWPKDKKPALTQFSITKGLLQNLKRKLPSEEKAQVCEILDALQPRKYLIIRSSLSDIPEEKAWRIYEELNTLVTRLHQLVKDSKWD